MSSSIQLKGFIPAFRGRSFMVVNTKELTRAVDLLEDIYDRLDKLAKSRKNRDTVDEIYEELILFFTLVQQLIGESDEQSSN